MPARLCPLVLVPVVAALAAAEDPAAIARRKADHRPRMSYLDNGTIKLGVDLNLGGAITYLSVSGKDDNVVNNWDWGRQVQMSHYGGPAPFRVPGKEPAKAWANFPWNPVQAGDHFGHASRVTESRNTGTELAVTCVPMQWSLDDVPCECTFSTRITLDGPTARVRCTLRSRRTDPARYPAFDQELPAVYVNGTYHRLMSYTGDEPFTGGELTRVVKKPGESPGFPWARFLATERWAAQVNDAGFGLGVYQPRCVSFLGGFAGKPGRGGTADAPTGYIAPTRPEVLDGDGVYEYEYTLILGTLDDIRRRANALHGKPAPPAYRFTSDRQGWTPAGGPDRGAPRDGEWDVPVPKTGIQLVGPPDFWQATAAPVLTVDAAFTAAGAEAHVYWATHADLTFAAARRVTLPVVGDGAFRAYTVRLADAPGYAGGITRLRLDPPTGADGGRVRVKSITLGPPTGGKP